MGYGQEDMKDSITGDVTVSGAMEEVLLDSSLHYVHVLNCT